MTRDPLSALRATSPEGGSAVCFTVFASRRRGKLPGGWLSAKYIFRIYSVGYFACAQYDGTYFTLSLIAIRDYFIHC